MSRIHYACTNCNARGVKLWRQYQTFLDNIELMCVDCAMKDQPDSVAAFQAGESDQIGWLIPAVPTELPDEMGFVPEDESFWGYTSVPDWGVKWWYDLAPVIPHAHPETHRVLMTRSEEEELKRLKRLQLDEEDARKILETEFIVEGSHEDSFNFWKMWHSVLSVVQDGRGFGQQIGELGGYPVCVTVFWHIVEGKRVAFVAGSSRVVDHTMVEEWVKETFPVFKRHQDARAAGDYNDMYPMANMSNIHHCLHKVAPDWSSDKAKWQQYERINATLDGR